MERSGGSAGFNTSFALKNHFGVFISLLLLKKWILVFDRIMGYLSWKDHQVHPPVPCKNPNESRANRWLSNLYLNASSIGTALELFCLGQMYFRSQSKAHMGESGMRDVQIVVLDYKTPKIHG